MPTRALLLMPPPPTGPNAGFDKIGLHPDANGAEHLFQKVRGKPVLPPNLGGRRDARRGS